MLVFETELELL